MTTIILEGEKPMGYNKILRLHWRARNDEAQRCKLLVRACLDPAWVWPVPPVGVVMTTYFASMKDTLDADNPNVKFYIDGLQGWAFPDDSPEYVRWVKLQFEIDQARPRVELSVLPAYDALPVASFLTVDDASGFQIGDTVEIHGRPARVRGIRQPAHLWIEFTD